MPWQLEGAKVPNEHQLPVESVAVYFSDSRFTVRVRKRKQTLCRLFLESVVKVPAYFAGQKKKSKK